MKTKLNIEKRFKMLVLLVIHSGADNILGGKMEELGRRIDNKDPQVIDAITYYEDKLIEILES